MQKDLIKALEEDKVFQGLKSKWEKLRDNKSYGPYHVETVDAKFYMDRREIVIREKLNYA